MICALFSVATTAIAFSQKGVINSELLVVSIQSMTDVVVFLSIALRVYTEIEIFMTSSQRIHQYTELPQEDDLEKEADRELQNQNWPSKGKIDFSNVFMKYREGLKPSISGLDCKVQQGMRVGIVGRTGAGKSSILQALFRLVELSDGNIKIDDVDLKTVGLHQLRKNIAFIPQMPFLLQGTIRENLDPFQNLSEEELTQIIKDIELDKKIGSFKDGLDTYCSESSNLFSVGQKQLVCLARAVARKTRLLVLDEATANIDLETDNMIQTKLRELFSGCTVLIIAHRLATIIDCDRILVMSEGKKGEFAHPYRLLVNELGDDTITNQNGLFAKMVMATGLETA